MGVEELIIIAVIVIVVVILGPSKIPQLARALGSAKKEFNEGSQTGFTGTSTATTAAADSAMGGDDLMMAARKLGISTEGKTREQISAEIVRKTAGT